MEQSDKESYVNYCTDMEKRGRPVKMTVLKHWLQEYKNDREEEEVEVEWKREYGS
jgi:hypothetical protein